MAWFRKNKKTCLCIATYIQSCYLRIIRINNSSSLVWVDPKPLLKLLGQWIWEMQTFQNPEDMVEAGGLADNDNLVHGPLPQSCLVALNILDNLSWPWLLLSGCWKIRHTQQAIGLGLGCGLCKLVLLTLSERLAFAICLGSLQLTGVLTDTEIRWCRWDQ